MNKISDSSLPNQEAPSDLPTSKMPVSKDYDQALARVTQALEQQPSARLEKVLFAVALCLCFILVIPIGLEWLSYPYWLELFYDLSIFVEVSLPLVVSFFLENKQHATILRVVGTIVLLMYLLTYF